jgi:hypothetical protein
LVGWKIAFYSIGNTENILEKKEKEFSDTIDSLAVSEGDEFKFASQFSEAIGRINTFLSLVNIGTESSKTLFQQILDISANDNTPKKDNKTKNENEAGRLEFMKARLRLEQIEKANVKLHEHIKHRIMKCILTRGSSFLNWLNEQTRVAAPTRRNFLKQLLFLINQECVASPIASSYQNDFRFLQLKKFSELNRLTLSNLQTEKSRSSSAPSALTSPRKPP